MPRATGSTPPLGGLDAASAARLAGTAGDVALVLDEQGSVLDVMAGGIDLPEPELRSWRGQAWADTVTAESRPKIEQLLADARADGGSAPPRWRQVNHALPGQEDVPVLYATVRLPAPDGPPGTLRNAGRVVAIGRDLRGVVTLQRRLVEAQQALEREYWRFREAETRYRHLFEVSSEPVVIVDAATQRIVEANPAARALCAGGRTRLVGASVGSLFDAGHGPRVQDLMAAARSIGRQAPVPVQLADGGAVLVSASMYRQDEASFVLLRLLPASAPAGRPSAAATGTGASDSSSALLQGFVEHSPDGLVFCDHGGVVLSANPAFLMLAQLGSESQVRGQPLDRWVGRTGVEIGVLIGNLRQRGTVGLFQTSMRGEFGARTEVEVTGAVVPSADGPGTLAFAVRDIERRLRPEAAGGPPTLQRSAAELAELVGRTPLKEIVAETSDLIEQLCIQTALQMTGDNRASAAQLLGLSRQSLYVKLRRYGLSDAPEPAETR